MNIKFRGGLLGLKRLQGFLEVTTAQDWDQQHPSQAPVANHSSVLHHQSYQPPDVHQPSQASFPLMNSGLVVPSFLPSDDPIASLNKKIAFISGYTGNGARSNATATGVNRTRGTNSVGQAKEIPTLAAFQTDDLDAFESDYDETPSASAVLIAKLSSYDSKVLSEVPIHDNYLDNHVIGQNVQEMQYSEQLVFNNETNIDITSDSNMISYEQYLNETENAVVQDTSSSAQQDAMIMSVIKEMSKQVAKCNEVDKVNKAVNESLPTELEKYKEQIKLFEERQNCDLNNREKYLDSRLREPHDALCVIDTEETLEMAEESRLKRHAKQNDPIVKEKKKGKLFEIKDKELIIENDRLLEHIICQDVMSVVMHADVESKNVLPANNNSLEHDNLEAELLKKENDRLIELIISQDLVHTHMNTLATVANHRNMEKSYLE
ncbi:hypothetical protein Tco_0975364 [Tanacetum coccineum]|uniref:Uncharacterized protein n=1 Tax=Tanacetum coccineum TaxID=301880 RepID=A0ABQ5EEG2_9ASTR